LNALSNEKKRKVTKPKFDLRNPDTTTGAICNDALLLRLTEIDNEKKRISDEKEANKKAKLDKASEEKKGI
jgi:hypothetical protein